MANDGIELTEVAPGVDVESDVLAHMDFRPKVSPQLRSMDARLFRSEPMNLKADMAGRQARRHPRTLMLDALS